MTQTDVRKLDEFQLLVLAAANLMRADDSVNEEEAARDALRRARTLIIEAHREQPSS